MNTPNFRVTTDLYASKEKRFGTYAVDIMGYYVMSFVLGVLLGVLALIGVEEPLNFMSSLDGLEGFILNLFVYFIYYTVFESLSYKTLGKYITKTKVVMEDGTNPQISDILIRTLCRLIPFDFLSFLGDSGRGWHDSISNTYVVDERKFNAKKSNQLELELIGVVPIED